jgi:CheY-like chemotaxis protein
MLKYSVRHRSAPSPFASISKLGVTTYFVHNDQQLTSTHASSAQSCDMANSGQKLPVSTAGLGRGSEFSIYLPGIRVATGTIQDRSTTELPSGSCGHRVLVADDNRDGAESLAMLLENLGFKVDVAFTGVEALALAAQHRPHAAILDIGMPGKSGYEVAQQIRREAWGSQVILIAVTGWGQEENRRAAHSAGFDHHFTKPVDLEALGAIISPNAAD